VSDLLPGTDGAYSEGSASKGWLNAYYKMADAPNDMLAKLRIGAKTPSDFPEALGLPSNYAYPFIDFYGEMPIGNKLARFIIFSDAGNLYFRALASDELVSKDILVFSWINGVDDLFALGGHLASAIQPFDIGIKENPFRDIIHTGFHFIGSTLARGLGSLPDPSVDYRGAMIRVEGGSGVADKLYCCMKKADNTYAWIQVASG